MRGLLWYAITVHDILLCFNWLPSQLYVFCLVQLKVAPSTHWEMQSRPLPTWRYSLIAVETFCKSQMLTNCWKLQRAFQTSRAKSSRNNDHTTQESCIMQLCVFVLLTLQYFIYCQNYIICVLTHPSCAIESSFVHLLQIAMLPVPSAPHANSLCTCVYLYWVKIIKGYLLTQSLNHQ